MIVHLDYFSLAGSNAFELCSKSYLNYFSKGTATFFNLTEHKYNLDFKTCNNGTKKVGATNLSALDRTKINADQY